jgi:hypothetical protein
MANGVALRGDRRSPDILEAGVDRAVERLTVAHLQDDEAERLRGEQRPSRRSDQATAMRPLLETAR